MIRILENVERWVCDYEKCGAKCCAEGIQLTTADIKKIISLGYSQNDFLDFDETNQVFRIKGKNGKCFFLGDKLECTVRENAPLVCRLLPFKIVEVSYADEPIMQLKPVVDCPGEGHGNVIDTKQIEADAMCLLRENQRLIRDLKTKGKKGVLEDI